MSLDRPKLQMVRELGNGGWQAQCPACAESGQDRKGEHLRLYPDGKFGCCVFPGDREHRKRIFALAGQHGPKGIKVRVASGKTATAVRQNLLGRLGRMFGSLECKMQSAECETEGTVMDIGTVGTGTYSLRERKKSEGDQLFIHKLIEFQEPVPSVPEEKDERDDRDRRDAGRRLPFMMADGTLVIPFNSPERYHWWKGGQSVRQTLAELKERKDLDASRF